MIDEQKYRALIQQLATGGITGNKTYHQYHDQYVPMDSESMMYAHGGGVGSMMQPRQNYALAGFIEDESETFTPNNFGLQLNNDNVDNNELAFTPESALDDQINKLNTLEKMGYSQPNLKNLKEMDMKQFKEEGIPLSLPKDEYVSNEDYLNQMDERQLTADSGMFANDATWGGNDSGVIYQGDIKEAPVINDFNRGPITYDQNTGRVPPGYKDGIMQMVPPTGRFSEFDKARMGTPVNTSLGYEDPIMNREENYTTFDDSFEEIPGYNFKDAPTSFMSRLKNPQFLNNPRRGIIDNQILGKGSQGEFGALNKVKNVGGKLASTAFGKIANLPVGLASFASNLFNKDPKAPKYMEYDPTGKIDYSKLNTNNLNDAYDNNPESDTYGTTRFDRAKPGSFASYRTLKDYFNRNKKIQDTGKKAASDNKKARDRKAAEDAAAANRRKIEAYTGRGMSDYRASRPSSERNYTGSGKSGMGRSADRFAAAGGIINLKR
tara:strand:- start:18 stop:1496 length:1479 start_codon:yes stop_codon:yes gene_type:complete